MSFLCAVACLLSSIEGDANYTILKKGTGDTVEPYSKPLIRFYEEGKSCEELLELDEIAFKEALVGMQEGEVRKLTFQNQVIEVEIIKADATFDAHAASQREDLVMSNQL